MSGELTSCWETPGLFCAFCAFCAQMVEPGLEESKAVSLVLRKRATLCGAGSQVFCHRGQPGGGSLSQAGEMGRLSGFYYHQLCHPHLSLPPLGASAPSSLLWGSDPTDPWAAVNLSSGTCDVHPAQAWHGLSPGVPGGPA